ncbi:MAG: sulfatase [Halobacteriota archaeon]
MDRPDVLFVVLDSVRVDRVSTYGHARATTPNLDDFAEHATVFERAFAPAPWTLPSHTSLFTGMAPTEHGVTNWFVDRPNGLPEDLEPLASTLASRGYRTAGFSNNPWVGSLSGLDRGFDEFVEWDLEISRRGDVDPHDRLDRLRSRFHSLLGLMNRQPIFLLKRRYFTAHLVERAIEWLRATATDDRPTFTFLNLMEAHSPYFPPRSSFRELGLTSPGPTEPRLLNTRLLAYVMGHADLSAAQRERVLEYYDASLRFQDGKVATLLEALRATGRFDNTLIVLCSDHGKNLGDIDYNAIPPHYTRTVNTAVPLVIKAPGQQVGRREQAPAELARLHGVITDGYDTPAATVTTDGFALVEEYSPHTGRERESTTAWRVLTDGEFTYVRSEDGQSFLFRDESDVPDDSSLRRWLDEALDERLERLQPAAEGDTTSAEIDGVLEGQLRDLGYLE